MDMRNSQFLASRWGGHMFDNMENLKIISSFHKDSKIYGKVEKRQSHGFIIKIKGHAEYFFEEKRVSVNAGEMIFLPKGTSYQYTSEPNEENLYTSINFQADLENPKIGVYSIADFYDVDYLYESFSEAWRFGNLSDRYKCTSVFYDLLSYILRTDHLEIPQKRKYHLIEPAVEYLKKNIYDTGFKINKLHRLCGISDTYFRKIFAQRFNMNPQEYVVFKRISYAKAIIESGDYESIREVSEMVGYSDPLYFSKTFRKIYGCSPSNINE